MKTAMTTVHKMAAIFYRHEHSSTGGPGNKARAKQSKTVTDIQLKYFTGNKTVALLCIIFTCCLDARRGGGDFHIKKDGGAIVLLVTFTG